MSIGILLLELVALLTDVCNPPTSLHLVGLPSDIEQKDSRYLAGFLCLCLPVIDAAFVTRANGTYFTDSSIENRSVSLSSVVIYTADTLICYSNYFVIKNYASNGS